MKIKYNGNSPDIEAAIALTDELVNAGIITDKDNQVLGIYDSEIQLDEIFPSDGLTAILLNYPDWKINTDPSETDAFNPEEGLPDVDKIGTVPDPTYQDEIEENINIELFPESENMFSEKSGRQTNNINNSKPMARKNFDDPNLTEKGVAIEATQTEVEKDQNQNDANYNPAEGEFSSVDVAPFTDEEIERANDVEVDSNDGEITVFTEEEIEEMTDPEEVEQLAETMETEEDTFAARQKRLFSAKRRLRKVNSKRLARKSFSDELTESEKSSVIEDIVAILEDAPEIKEAVVEEVDDLTLNNQPEAYAETEETETETEVETPVETTETTTETETETVPEVTETETETTVETPAEPETEEEEETEEEVDVEAFSEEEIEEAPEVLEEAPLEETEVETEVETEPESETETESEEGCESEGEKIGRIFNKAFAEDPIKNFRHQVLADMASKQQKKY